MPPRRANPPRRKALKVLCWLIVGLFGVWIVFEGLSKWWKVTYP